MRFSPTVSHNCRLSGRPRQAGKVGLFPVSLDDHSPALCTLMSGFIAPAAKDQFVSAAIELPKPQVLVGKANHQESKQRALYRRRPRNHLTIAVWTFHVDPPQITISRLSGSFLALPPRDSLQLSRTIVACPVEHVKRPAGRMQFFHPLCALRKKRAWTGPTAKASMTMRPSRPCKSSPGKPPGCRMRQSGTRPILLVTC
jgi:hypothetical protein